MVGELNDAMRQYRAARGSLVSHSDATSSVGPNPGAPPNVTHQAPRRSRQASQLLAAPREELNHDRSALPTSFRYETTHDDGSLAAARALRVESWVNQQTKVTQGPEREGSEAPGAWIDQYRVGRGIPRSCVRVLKSPAGRAAPEKFSGRSLDWFGWIDQFRSQVHLTPREPGEKYSETLPSGRSKVACIRPWWRRVGVPGGAFPPQGEIW